MGAETEESEAEASTEDEEKSKADTSAKAEDESEAEASAEDEEESKADTETSAEDKEEPKTEASKEAKKDAEADSTTETKATEAETESAAEMTTEAVKKTAAELEANIEKLKAYEDKLDALTSEDAAKIQALLNAISDDLEANEASLSEEDEAFLNSFAEKFNNASIQTVEETVSINQQITDGTTEITVSTDTTEDVVIPSGKSITLKIAEGVTLTNKSGHTVTVTSGGKLTIESDGTIDNVTHAKAALEVKAGGTAIIKSGTFTRSKENGISKTDNGGNSYYIIRNHGKLTIEDATVESGGHYSSLIENGYQDYAEENTTSNHPVLTINGGTFAGGINTIKNDDDGYLYIHGGVFDNMTQNAVLNWHKAEISGGTFRVAEDAQSDTISNRYNGNKDHFSGSMVITGGSFGGGTIWSNAGSELDVQNIDDVGLICLGYSKSDEEVLAAEVSLTAEPEKDSDDVNSYSFVGWFDADGNAYAEGKTITKYTEYKPVFLATKIESKANSAEITESEETDTKAAVASSVGELIKQATGGSTDQEESKVKVEAADNVDLEAVLKEAVASNEAIEAVVVLTDADASKITSAEKTAVAEAVGDKTLAQYVNIDIELLVASKKVANITQLDDTIEITMDLPAALQASNRKFSVIRLHDDKAETLDTKTLAGGKQISFKTDKFSLYAVAYELVRNSTSSSGGGGGSSSSSVNAVVVNNGSWMQDNVGWWFKKADGSYPKDAWYECVWNGASNWYHFNAQGYADGGWLVDKDGQKYYLHNVHDGKFGYMYTGWHQIADKWYFFNTTSGTTGPSTGSQSKGSLVSNTTTADGYKVGADGAWIE